MRAINDNFQKIVEKKSATFGLPGTRETIISVNSNHSDVCKFDHSDVCKFEGDDVKLEPIKRAIGKLAGDAIEEEKEKRVAAKTERASSTLISPDCK